ncbi:MAG: bifunctional GTP diphosphokinase/guanosine-3',5'-bis pyrophosphate 3'-pyrophosphohydrolase [Gammaproteobacteria bacterium]|nr:bifunctional GTP diphosphokinase/guanosine-3',5'-bis pyrophosphate 3'-pyrophosphohydrolase [Gammaproteobacteria bacterium]MDE2345356.1 bifunctional GTP diphosphokinase/guanosine-3',5'-bis pyrophosphate 3'-pyrophosphohydrolase [Gammaproteobacteria bacterium]
MSQPASIFDRVLGKRTAGIDILLTKLRSYLPQYQVDEIHKAYEFGARAHEGQRRVSGEPYISHPVAVASILADLHMDQHTIEAALLHDVIEDTPTLKEELTVSFGQEVAKLVDGVSKLTQIKFTSREQAQAENFRKMVLAMVDDIRIILVKLADRLHNMRTLGAMPPPKRRRIASETLAIYAPIAHRLGMNAVRLELEDLGFEALHPLRYKVLAKHLKRSRGHQKEMVKKISLSLTEALQREHIEGGVVGREKHLYSIYHKMQSKGLSLSEVLDVYGFRIIVDKTDACYRVLGIVHNLYKPVPGRFKDYIAIPKANGYQSLHTVLIGPQGAPLEVQIRTTDMDKVAGSGIAAHWLYKSGEGGATPTLRAREWLKDVVEMQRSAGSSQEFLDNVRVDLFPDEVYVFTPQGDIHRLPRGATAVDFAYSIHTDVGNACVAAKINRRLVPLRTPLENGQTVEIITAANGRPNPVWLNFVVTAKARANVRHFLKNLRHEDAIELGRRMLEGALASLSMKLSRVPEEHMQNILREFKLHSLDDLFESIGLGQHLAPLVARRLLPDSTAEKKTAKPSAPLAITGTEGMVVSFARCCHPIPGDAIVGILTSGKGIVIHRDDCGNLNEYRNQPDKMIEVQWEKRIKREFPVEIRADVANQRGVLATVAAAIAETGSNIEHVNQQERDDLTSVITFVFGVKDRQHLARTLRKLRSLPQVMRIQRTRA